MTFICFFSGQESLINAISDELPRIQEQVYYGYINSRTDVLDKFLSEDGISRYNPQVKECLESFWKYHFYKDIIIVMSVVILCWLDADSC